MPDRVVKLEQKIRALQATCDAQAARIDRLETQLAATKAELAEERAQHAHERAQHRKTKQQLQEVMHAVQHVDERYRALLRRDFGASSERLLGRQDFLREALGELDPETAQAFDDLHVACDEALRELAPCQTESTVVADSLTAEGQTVGDESSDTSTRRQRPANSGGRNALPANLPQQHSLYNPPDDHPMLKHASSYEVISRTVINRLSLEPLRLVNHHIDCPIMKIVYGAKFRLGTRHTMAPPAILPKGQVDDAVIVHSACDKILNHLPSYRQSQIFGRMDIDLPRSKLCRWHIALGAFLSAVHAAVLEELLQEPVLGIDDTVHRLIDVIQHRCKHGRLWAVQGAVSTYYFFTETREGSWIDAVLSDYTGSIMGDAYSGHNTLLRRDDITALFCWAHVRRKFFDACRGLKRDQALHLIQQLYAIERSIADQPPDQKVMARVAAAKPILSQFKQLLDAWQADPTVLPKSGIGRATSYALNHWEGLVMYLTIGDAPIDNNHTERAMRPNALHRKNSLFSATKRGAENYAILSTLIHSACAHGLNPEQYLNDILKDLHYEHRSPAECTPAAYAARTGTDPEALPPSWTNSSAM